MEMPAKRKQKMSAAVGKLLINASTCTRTGAMAAEAEGGAWGVGRGAGDGAHGRRGGDRAGEGRRGGAADEGVRAAQDVAWCRRALFAPATSCQ
jgi:hypothetical protein